MSPMPPLRPLCRPLATSALPTAWSTRAQAFVPAANDMQDVGVTADKRSSLACETSLALAVIGGTRVACDKPVRTTGGNAMQREAL